MADELPASPFSLHTEVLLSQVKSEKEIREFLECLKGIVVVELRPVLARCYALGPYTIFDKEGKSQRAELGELLYNAKFRGSKPAFTQLSDRLLRFVARHPILRGVDSVVAPPKTDSNTADIGGSVTADAARIRGFRLVRASKTRQTEPQKELVEGEDESKTAARVANSMRVEGVRPGDRVLIIDDTIGSGGTMKELARVLHLSGARWVFGLSVAKDAKFTRGMELLRERWQ